jgi:general secretion pathway protein G
VLADPAVADSGRVTGTRARIADLESALVRFARDNGRLPTTEEGLDALAAVPLDEWGNAFHYRQPGVHNPGGFDLWSLGADGQPGGECVDADLGNWAGAEGDPCTSGVERVMQVALLGAALVCLVLIPVHLARTAHGALRAKTWRPIARNLPMLVLLAILVAWLWLGIVQWRIS